MKIKFVTWNVNYGKRWKKAIELIKKFQPDILALQEVSSFFPYFNLENVNVLKEFQKALPYLKHSCFAPAMKREKNRKLQQLGNAVFSKYKIANNKITYLDKQLHWSRCWWNRQAKNLLEAKIKINSKPLFVYSTHLSFFPLFLDTKKRLKQAEKILETIKGKKPLIIGGDFNGKPKSKVIRKMKNVLNTVNYQNKPTFKFKGFQYKLDYVFHSPDLKAKSCQILETNASDHRPIIVEFEWE